MGRERTDNRSPNPVKAQLLLLRAVVLAIPIYMFTLSPTCGAFGPSVPKNDALSGLTFAATIPGIIFSLIGVFGRSNAATGISGVIITVIIVANTTVEPYFTILDFIMVLVYLETATTLTTFSELAESLKFGTDENVSYNYRLAIRAYARRLVAITLVTLLGSLGAVLFVLLFSVQIAASGLAVLAMFSLMLIFIVIATSYGRR